MSHAGFFDDNRRRAYPFLTGSVGRPVSGPIALNNLPNSAIVDCGFTMGPKVEFDSAVHSVRLARVRRISNVFYFEFESNCPYLAGAPIVFTCPSSSTGYVTHFSDSADEGLSLSNSHSSFNSTLNIRAMCKEPIWEGFLVTGDLTDLGQLLAGDGVLEGTSNYGTVEPALLVSLFKNHVIALNTANNDRVRHVEPEDCPPLAWPYPISIIYTNQLCIRGDVVFFGGFNTEIRQSDTSNAIVITPRVGAGKGEPCGEVKLFDAEIPPPGRNQLDGSFACGETLKTINGKGGSLFTFTSKKGVRIEPKPDQHEVVFHVDLAGTQIQVPEEANSI